MVDPGAPAPAAPPKDAATVIVLRLSPAAAGRSDEPLEVFCVRRHAQSAFLGGVVVFPGGKLDAADGDDRLGERCNGVHPRASRFAASPSHALALAICACRESLEEAELLPCVSDLGAPEVAAMRAELAAAADGPSAEGSLSTLLGQRSLRLDTAALVPFARWITPLGERRRYDTRFFVVPLPAGQTGHHDEHETVSSLWAAPRQLLCAYAAGDLFLAPPTIRMLSLLADCADVEAALSLAADQSLQPICPEFVPGDVPMVVLPGDPQHSVPERRVAGPTRFVVRDGIFVAEDPQGN